MTKKITIAVPEQLIAQLAAQAEIAETSLSEMLRRAVGVYLELLKRQAADYEIMLQPPAGSDELPIRLLLAP